MDEDIDEVNIQVETDDLFVVSSPINELKIDNVGEHLAYFDLKVTDRQGVGKVKITVSSGKESAYYEMELQVRNPNPRVFEVSHHLIEGGDIWKYNPQLLGMEGTNELNIMVSALPSLNLEKRLKYLIRYPYGCIEQTTSSIFPQLYLDQLLVLDDQTRKEVEMNIRKGIRRLERFTTSTGGFAYWPGGRQASDWSTSYAGHFLLLAKDRGYYVSSSMLNAWINHQRNVSNSWDFKREKALSQAYRLYTLALAGKPNVSAMNRLREEDELGAAARFRLAAAYALLGQEKVAMELINNLEYSAETGEQSWRYNFGSTVRDQSMVLETYLLLGNKAESFSLFREIAAELRSEAWMSTQTTAFALYAASLFVEDREADDDYSFQYKWNRVSSEKINGSSAFYSADLAIGEKNELEVENLSENELFVTVTRSGIPPLEDPIEMQHNLDVTIKYFDMNGDPINVRNISHGLDFYAEVLVKYPGKFGYIENVALSQIFPSGWEIINTRLLDVGEELKSDRSDYIDIRDDRVNTFFSMGSGQTKRFVVLLNAAYQGRFFMPATQCGAMYNNEVSSTVGGGWVNVSK
jgi:uncharacterized protein YfaS (alpha-2-macroglobulin family)